MELSEKYQVSAKIARSWLQNDYLVPLLDGLDELQIALQPDCVAAINDYIDGSKPSGLVVCCRLLEYQWLPKRLKLNGAIRLRRVKFDIFPLGLADSARESLFTTCVWNDDPIVAYKLTEYLERLAVAHRTRHVAVKMLFIISPGDEENEKFRRRLEDAKNRGFENGYVTTDDWIKNTFRTARVPEPVDFSVWDRRIVLIYTCDKLQAEWHTALSYAAEYLDTFNTLWLYARQTAS